MITKQQALEFIYELSQKTEVKIDVPNGTISVYEDYKYGGVYRYKFEKEKASLEELVTGFIKSYLDISLLENIKIPVDTDMLEIGQTYMVEFFDCIGVPDSFTAKLLSINEGYETVFSFSNGYYTGYVDIKEIYKVNNDN